MTPGQVADAPLIQVRNLRKTFPVFSGTFRRRRIGEVLAVDDVSLDIYPGEVVGCVGETGSGKSTLGRLILNLVSSDAGQVMLDGVRIDHLPPPRMNAHRRDMQMVFQDPLHALNPRRTVAENVALPLVNFGMETDVIARRVRDLLELVGLNPAHANRYPHEFSGGQCQRIGIARALALNPRFLFLDEPVSALDVSVQAQILNLLMELREKLNLAYLFVTHDLKIVRHFAHRIIVLYHGRIMETGATDDIYVAPKHPYTRALLDAVLRVEAGDRWQRVARGADDAADAEAVALEPGLSGCIYAGACSERFAPCRTVVPRYMDVGHGRRVACHLHDPLIPSPPPVVAGANNGSTANLTKTNQGGGVSP